MATVKAKYRPSSQEGKEGTIYYQVIHKRVARQINTGYHVFKEEWDSETHKVITTTTSNSGRENVLAPIMDGMARDMKRLEAIIAKLENSGEEFTADDVVSKYQSPANGQSFFRFMEDTIARLKLLGKARTSETYTSAMNSFKRFLQSRAPDDNGNNGNGDGDNGNRNDMSVVNEADILPDEMDSDMMAAYEAYLRNNGVSPNSSSFYMRNLRAVYNRAVEKNLTVQRFPFKHVYTGVEKTAKRAVPLKVIRQIREMDLFMNPALDFARDMFLFSFYTRGMSFVDMAYLRKKDLNNGILSYRRRKTGQQLFIKWEKCMQEITDKYDTAHSGYLLPIIKPASNTDERKQYIYVGHSVNRNLKVVGERLGLPLPLTMYVARHAWASIARSKNVPLSVISEGMGHDSEATTRIYLASLDNMAVDKANSLILKSL